MPAVAIPAALAIASSVMGKSAADKAADRQAEAADMAAAAQRKQYKQARRDMLPYQQAGTSALSQYQQLLTGQGGRPPEYDIFTNSPGYQFQQQEGQKAIEAGAAARGGLLSGATQKALTKYGQNVASQQYGTFMDRLQGLSAQGQNAAQGQAAQAMQYGAAQVPIYQSIGQAGAGGIVAGQNQISGGMQTLGGLAGNMGRK